MKIRHLFWTALFVAVPALRAVINPSMQPRHLFDLYDQVFQATLEEVDSREMRAVFRIDDYAKGKLPYKSVTLTAGREQLTEMLSLQADLSIVVFAGRAGSRTPGRVLYYVGGGSWHKAEMGSGDKADQWVLQGNADAGVDPGSVDIMFAVFNGQIEMLWRMVRDLGKDRAYFPATPFTRFEARKIDQLGGGAGRGGGVRCQPRRTPRPDRHASRGHTGVYSGRGRRV